MNHCRRSRFSFLLFLALLTAYFPLHPSEAGSEPTELYATASDGTPLHWVVYTPAGTGPWPAVLVIHGGGFKSGNPTSGPEAVTCGRDLAAAGFIAFSIEYRLAPDGSLEGQVSDGRFPDQSDDVKLAVLAARSDPRCNGKVGSVGGSAGGYQTAFVAGTGTIGQDRIDAGVSLSGAYDLSDFSSDPNIGGFTKDVTNYVGVDVSDVEALRAASPAWLADANTAPLLLVHTMEDSMPFSQQEDMTSALDALGVTTYEAITLPGAQHAFANWSEVKDRAIVFLSSWFQDAAPPPPVAPPTKMLLNVSTRARVESGANVMIGGFIITGDAPKKVALRAIGPSLAAAGVTGALADPALQLFDSTGTLIAQNDNCSSLAVEEIPAGLQPANGRESLISMTLPPGSYTAVLSGANGGSGVGLFELYDLDPASSRIANISTRSEVGNESDVMIGGFIVGGNDPTKVVLRAVGPSLTASGITNPLPDPVLDLYDGNGSLIFTNDNWRTSQLQQISDTGVSPGDDREAAIVATLLPGGYTAIVHDAAGGKGVALVEVYDLEL
jgi:acetyl esterase/lipase